MPDSPKGEETTQPDVTTNDPQENQIEEVTRNQNGQYIEESSGLERVVVPHSRPSGQVESQDLDSVRAKNVTMNQSGAEQIDAETVSLNSAGARSIRATTVEMKNSGAVTVAAERIDMTQSSGLLVAGGHVEMNMSGALGVQAENVTFKGEAGTGILIAREVTAENDFRVGLGIIGNVSGGSKVEVLLDAKSAIALGAGFAIVFRLLGKIFHR